jgi:hypothetical protein
MIRSSPDDDALRRQHDQRAQPERVTADCHTIRTPSSIDALEDQQKAARLL